MIQKWNIQLRPWTFIYFFCSFTFVCANGSCHMQRARRVGAWWFGNLKYLSTAGLMVFWSQVQFVHWFHTNFSHFKIFDKCVEISDWNAISIFEKIQFLFTNFHWIKFLFIVGFNVLFCSIFHFYWFFSFLYKMLLSSEYEW